MITKNGFETTLERSILMSKIRSRNTKPEILLRKTLWKMGYRFRTHISNLPGKPDILFKTKKIAIFVDGEFWHGYKWDERKFKIKSNEDYWINKIERNMARDLQNQKKLIEMGYRVLRFWDSEIKKDVIGCITQIEDAFKSHR